MSPTYYQIELSARMLTVLLVTLALLLVLAFAFGYGAAWSVLGGDRDEPTARVTDGQTPAPTVAVAQPTRMVETVSVPALQPARSEPTATPRPRPTATPRPLVRPPTQVPVVPGQKYFWVQVLAGRSASAIEKAQATIEQAGYPRSLQRIVRSNVAGGGILYKLRIGPLPDRAAANRVVEKVRNVGFPDAWVLQP
jgi:cell division septation protein DedD